MALALILAGAIGLALGVPAYSTPEDNRFLNTLLMPFKKQREYWRHSDGKVISGRESIRRAIAPKWRNDRALRDRLP